MDPPHLHILNGCNVEQCGCNVEQCGCIVEQCGFPHFNVNKCRYIVGQHNGDLR